MAASHTVPPAAGPRGDGSSLAPAGVAAGEDDALPKAPRARGARRYRLAAWTGLSLALASAPWALWIHVQAPTPGLWFVAGVLAEFSLGLALIATVALLLAVLAWRGGRRTLPLLTLALGLPIVGAALWPSLEAAHSARLQGVPLSLRDYFGGFSLHARTDFRTLTYGAAGGRDLRADVWRPTAPATAPRPAVIVLQGGGWRGHQRSRLPRWNAWLVDQGYVVLDIDYRTPPPARWQHATGDVKCAVAWVRRRANRLGVDPERIVLLGEAGGAHLALLAAYTASDTETFPPSCPGTDTSVAAVIAIAPLVDLSGLRAGLAQGDPLGLGRYIDAFTGGSEEIRQLASPLAHVDGHAPPTLLIHGGRDRRVPSGESEHLARALAAASVPHRLVRLEHADHPFLHSWGGWGSQIARPAILGFLQTHLPPDATAPADP